MLSPDMLLTHFHQYLRPAGVPVDPLRDAGLTQTLTELIDRARADWPQLDIAVEDFVAFCAQRVDSADAGALRSLHASDLYLCCGCAQGDLNALHAFEEKMIPIARSALDRTGVQAELSEEALQQLRLRLFVPDEEGRTRIHSYTGRGPLASWLRVTVVRLMLNIKQSQQRYVPVPKTDELLDALPTAPDSEFLFLKSAYAVPCREALKEAAAALPPLERTLLSLHFIDGLSIDRIAPLYHISRATAARWLAHARDALLRETQRRLAKRLNLSQAEALHLLRELQSQLLSSLRGLLRPTSATQHE